MKKLTHCVRRLKCVDSLKDTLITDKNQEYKILDEVKNDKMYRECNISFGEFEEDIKFQKNEMKISDLEIIFKDLKNLFRIH